jgi:hypothetical protein
MRMPPPISAEPQLNGDFGYLGPTGRRAATGDDKSDWRTRLYREE